MKTPSKRGEHPPQSARLQLLDDGLKVMGLPQPRHFDGLNLLLEVMGIPQPRYFDGLNLLLEVLDLPFGSCLREVNLVF